MTPLSELLRPHGISLKSYALGDHRTICPKCSGQRRKSNEPCLSVTINDDGAVWNCHHCGEKGGVKDREEEVKPARSRRRQLAEQGRPRWPQLTTLLPWATEYLIGRGISLDTLTWAGVSCARAYFGEQRGERAAIAFVYREPGSTEPVNAKFRTPDKDFAQVKGGKAVFYLLDKVDTELGDTLIITEGEVDALSCWQAAVPNTVSVPNGAPKQVSGKLVDAEEDRKFSFVWEAKELLDRFPKVVLAVDSDEPGQALAEELARRIGREKCWLVTWPADCKDANDVLRRHGPQAIETAIAAAKPHPIKSLFAASVYNEAVLALYAGVRRPLFSTGWTEIDRLFRLREGELSVVTGHPSSGKSEFVDALTINMANTYGWTFAMCSFENSPDEHIAKLIEKYAGQPFWPGPTPRMTQTSVELGLAWVDKHYCFIRAEDESPNLDWLLEKAGAAVMRHGIRGLVIDPYNEMEHQRPAAMNETEYVAGMLAKVKRFAAMRGVHVWFIAHPTKPFRLKDGTPAPLTLYDISGSAAWNAKADIGLVVQRDYDHSEVKIDVKKVRFKYVGKVGVGTLEYDRVTGRYSERLVALAGGEV